MSIPTVAIQSKLMYAKLGMPDVSMVVGLKIHEGRVETNLHKSKQSALRLILSSHVANTIASSYC